MLNKYVLSIENTSYNPEHFEYNGDIETGDILKLCSMDILVRCVDNNSYPIKLIGKEIFKYPKEIIIK